MKNKLLTFIFGLVFCSNLVSANVGDRIVDELKNMLTSSFQISGNSVQLWVLLSSFFIVFIVLYIGSLKLFEKLDT